MRRLHVYPVFNPNRVLVSAAITRDSPLVPSTNYYTMKIGVARKGRVDYYGTFDGSRNRMDADVPFRLVRGGSVALQEDDSVVLDIEAFGRPVDLDGTSVTVEVGSSAKDPGYYVAEQGPRDAIDGLANYILSTQAGTHVVTLALPKQIIHDIVRQEYNDYDDVSTPVASLYSTFQDGNVSLTITAPSANPAMVMITAHASVEGSAANQTVYIAIGDGTTDHNVQYGKETSIGDEHVISTSYAEALSGQKTYKTRFAASGTVPAPPNVLAQSITAVLVEQ